MLKNTNKIFVAIGLFSILLLPSFASTHASNEYNPIVINGKIAFVETGPQRNLIVANGDGSNPTTIYSEPSGLMASPSWSPDGKRLAFSSTYGVGSNADIFIINRDGTNKINLTNNPDRDEAPTWSPDGSKIAFLSDRGRATADYRLHLMDSDGSNQIEIASPLSTQDSGPSWSPDGSKIYYSSTRSGVAQIYVYDINTTSDTLFASNPTSANRPRVSPDGTKVLYIRAGPGDSKVQIYNADIDGSNEEKLFQLCSEQPSQWASWSPDGQKILFMSDCGSPNDYAVYIVNKDGTNLHKVTEDGKDHWGPTDWHGAPISFYERGQSGKIRVKIETDNSQIDYEVYKDMILLVGGKAGDIVVHGSGTLSGRGATGKVTVQTNGSLAPGESPGCIASGDLNMSSGSTLEQEIGGKVACTGYDQMQVTGTVTLTNPTLNVVLFEGFMPSVGDTFTVIDNDGADAVSGIFSGLPEGETFEVSGVTYEISYLGGDGNDVVLGVTSVAEETTAIGVPDTGFYLARNNPIAVLTSTTLLAAAIFAISRKFVN